MSMRLKTSLPGRDSTVGRKARGMPQGLSEKLSALADGVVTGPYGSIALVTDTEGNMIGLHSLQ